MNIMNLTAYPENKRIFFMAPLAGNLWESNPLAPQDFIPLLGFAVYILKDSYILSYLSYLSGPSHGHDRYGPNTPNKIISLNDCYGPKHSN